VVAGVNFGVVYRLKKTDEFSSVFAFRHSLRGGPFQLFYRPNGLATARLGVVVGKRFVRHAVKRNRIKRVAREAFRWTRSGLPACDLVLRVASKPQNMDRGTLREGLDALFGKLRNGVRLP